MVDVRFRIRIERRQDYCSSKIFLPYILYSGRDAVRRVCALQVRERQVTLSVDDGHRREAEKNEILQK